MPVPADAGDTLKVRRATPADAARWDAFVDRHAELPPFARFAWDGVLRQVFASELIGLLAEDADGETRGVLALYPAKDDAGAPRLFTLNRGLVADTAVAETCLLDHAQAVCGELTASGVDISTARQPAGPQGLGPARQAIVLPLADDEERTWSALRGKTRNMIRKAHKQALTVDFGLQHLQAFYRIYAQRMLQLGVPIYGLALFEAIAEGFGQDAELIVARNGHEIISGLLLIHGAGTSVYPFQATVSEHMDSAATQLLIWEAARAAIRRGQRRLDMGESRPGSPVHKSKLNFGGSAEDVFQFSLEAAHRPAGTRRPALSRRVMRRLSAEALRRGPLWLRQPAGLWLKRQGRLLF